MNFTYTIDPNSEEPIMLIDKHIGYDEQEGMGIDGGQFVRELLTLDAMGKKRIQVWINSVGGSVTEGQQISFAILNSKAKVDTYCMGIAASIALPIFLSGRKRYMSDYALLMTHPVSGGSYETNQIFKDSIITLVSGRSKKSSEEINAMMNRTTWIDSSEAIEYGMCDEVILSSEANKKHLRSEDLKAAWKEANLILNKVITTPQYKMSKINNRLNLNDQANEESQVAAIDKIENRAKEAESLNNSLKTELEAVKNQLAEKETALTTLQKEKEDAEKTAAEEKITNSAKELVNGFKNKIGSDEAVVNTWVELAKKDLEGTKKALEAIPVNKQGVSLKNTITDPVVKNTAASIMMDINKRTNPSK